MLLWGNVVGKCCGESSVLQIMGCQTVSVHFSWVHALFLPLRSLSFSEKVILGQLIDNTKEIRFYWSNTFRLISSWVEKCCRTIFQTSLICQSVFARWGGFCCVWGRLKFLGWICVVCLFLTALKKYLQIDAFTSREIEFPIIYNLYT